MNMKTTQLKCAIYARKSSEDSRRQVQSIDDQIKIMSAKARQNGIEVIKIIKESKSAKIPDGRPEFNELVKMIKNQKINCVACWKLDRLARNMVDGAQIIQLLQDGKIQQIITHDRVCLPDENSLLLSVEFGMSNQFVRDLSKTVKRGIKSKIEKGWWPGLPPIGYLNDEKNHTIILDKKRAPIVRKIFEHMITGAYTPLQILEKVNNDWNYTSAKRKKSGGRKMASGTMYKLLKSPFYAGKMLHKGEIFDGKHPPIITWAEFERVQKMIKSDIAKKSRKEEFHFGGTMKCGECGCSITAQNTTNRFGTHYVYYRCTHKKKETNCKQRYIEQTDLEEQIKQTVDPLTMPEKYLKSSLVELKKRSTEETTDNTLILQSVHHSIEECENKLNDLLDMKLNEFITAEEYAEKKNKILIEKSNLEEKLKENQEDSKNWIALAEDSFNFMVYAKLRLQYGTIEDKKKILLGLGSNPTLLDKKVNISLQNYLQIINDSTRALNQKKPMFQPLNFGLDKGKNTANNDLMSSWQGR